MLLQHRLAWYVEFSNIEAGVTQWGPWCFHLPRSKVQNSVAKVQNSVVFDNNS